MAHNEASESQLIATPLPWLSPVSYWMPPQLVVSAWHEHAPFAYWLMDALRPRTVVELGTHNGFSFLTFAEAAKRLGFNSQLFAIDSWVGDDQAGFYGNDVYDSVVEITQRDYGNSTTLIRGYFADVADTFANGSVDLLHIDGRHELEDVTSDFETYLPKVSNSGVILFHDTSEVERNFGVWKLWERLSAQYPSFAFTHGHGLGVLVVGEAVPQSVLDFVQQANDNPDAVRASYSALGEKVSRQFALEVTHFELIDSLRRQIMAQESSIAELQSAKDAALEAERAIKSSTSWRATAALRWVTSRVRST